ncbi:hypothetical protein [Bacillus pseudomycoides]|uniref:hypothetical protein n=1 Tax=Bacillus pseudomycoides TaxID=64104 RepID=UPI000330A970|nr:hypothetical protein [Bacillus pseudomycoides]EOP57374.1 hypothetical protein IIW_00184 [Bacillus cereus VD136]EOP75051.1 hypothetical protein KOW_02510 [Bacillus cereus VDM006]OOG91383.1 hypothetical protein BTH41_01490 [Bacillus mycoides]
MRIPTIINWVHQYESELNNPYESKRVMDVFIPIVEGFPSVGDEALHRWKFHFIACR